MTLLTPCASLPYPERADPPDVQKDMEALALAVDTAICGTAESSNPIGGIMAWWDTGNSPLPVGKLRCDGAVFDGGAFPALAAHLGNTTTPDLQGRFLRGADDTFASGQFGGSDTASLPAHIHGLNKHVHSIAHKHAEYTTPTGGEHDHTGRYLTTSTGSGSNADLLRPYSFSYTYVGRLNVSRGGHNHVVKLPTLQANSGQPSNTDNTTSTGTDADYGNLPQFVGVVFLIQAI